ncbi:hypothetical protein Tco_0059023 [Tanacetum coccineum]
MDMSGYEVPHVLVTCRSRQIDDENDDDENVPLNYSINNDLSIQFGREEFCLVTGLRFGVENREEYDTQANLPFRRRVFPSHLDGQPITDYMIPQKIDSLLDEFADELTLLHSIPPGIDDVNLDPEGDILFLESLLYDNSSPRSPEEFSLKSNESFSHLLSQSVRIVTSYGGD